MLGSDLVSRFDPANADVLLKKRESRPFFNKKPGKPMKGLTVGWPRGTQKGKRSAGLGGPGDGIRSVASEEVSRAWIRCPPVGLAPNVRDK